jgi:hypothetical protein
VLSAADLHTVAVTTKTRPSALTESQALASLGERVRQALPAGTLLTASDLTTETFPSADEAVVGLELTAADTPSPQSRHLRRGGAAIAPPPHWSGRDRPPAGLAMGGGWARRDGPVVTAGGRESGRRPTSAGPAGAGSRRGRAGRRAPGSAPAIRLGPRSR